MLKRALTVGIAIAALLTVAAPAESQVYPPPTAGVFVSDTTVVPGQPIVIQAGGFAPGTPVTFSIGGIVLGTVTADAGGIATLEVDVPADLAPGTYTITATGVAPDGSPLTVETTITVVADADDDGVADGDDGVGAGGVSVGGGLPRTGSDSVPLARVAAALVALGGGLLFITRRRRTTIA